ncbi:MAG: hypothetical protein R3D43_14125 [Tepidamorphaceae bacterium]
MRYGVGVGREEAFNFKGEATIARKAKWPDGMIEREPERPAPEEWHARRGRQPVGASCAYLYRDGKDTYYRLHGTVEPDDRDVCRQDASANQDIIDLYDVSPLARRSLSPQARPG